MQLRRIIRVLGGVAAAAALPLWCAAQVKPEVAATIKKTLESRFEGTKVIDVQPSLFPGIYEVFVGNRIVYSDATGDHLIVGSILDTRAQKDLTEARMEERGSIDFKSLPFAQAIKIVRGNGRRQLAVFEDPDCPFCQRLEKELASIKDTTEYVFLFPIDSLHPQATVHAHAIWCAPNRAQAWTEWLTEKKPPPTPTAACAHDPIPELTKLGESLYIDGTPTSFLASGKRVGGAIPTEEWEKLLIAESGPASGPASGAGSASATAPPAHAGEAAAAPQKH